MPAIGAGDLVDRLLKRTPMVADLPALTAFLVVFLEIARKIINPSWNQQ